MKKILVRYTYLIPPIQLLITLLFTFIDLERTIENSYILEKLGNAVGYSIFTGLVYIRLFCYSNYCVFTKFSAVAIFTMSLINLLGNYINYELYSDMYDRIIIIATIVLTILYSFKDEISNIYNKQSTGRNNSL